MSRPRIRVAYLTAGLESGGSERQMLALAGALPTDRFEVDFLLFADRGAHADIAEATGARIQDLGLGRRRDVPLPIFVYRLVRMVVRYVRIVRARRYDLVDAWLFHAYVLAAVMRPIAGPPILISGRRSLSDFKDGFWLLPRMLDAIARRGSDLFVANAEEVRRDVIQRERLDPSRIVVIRNGVELPRPIEPAERIAIREAWGVPVDAVVAGCVTNLKRGKGLEMLVRVADRVVARQPRVHFVVVGEGTLRSELESEIRARGLTDRVHLVGWERDARRVYGAFDVAVQASETEGLPNVVLEAAAAGCAIAATDAGGTREIVHDGHHGIVVGVRDEEGLVAALERLVNDPQLRDRFGRAARERVATEFSIDRLVTETAALYAGLVDGAGV